MSLKLYRQKRDFSRTSEPSGAVKKKSAKSLRFVVQKHDASRLHYDFRLEVDGVLKSWAVPKGPSLNPKDKHLAIMVEDHPFSYRTFEGTIPKGNYGAGEVIVWDEGTYEPFKPTDDPNARLNYGLNKGHVHIIMRGQKLKGEFSLIKKASSDDENAWLLMKHADEYASDDDITERTESVRSDRRLSIDEGNMPAIDAPQAGLPHDVKPMLATLVDEPFDSDDWLYEIKWDGYRAVGSWDGHTARLYSRNSNDLSKKFPAVYEALRQLPRPAVIDGEVVSLDEAGKARFEWLQNYQRDPQGQLACYVFDLLWYDGHDLRGMPLVDRKEILAKLIKSNDVLRYSDHLRGQGKRFFAMAQEQQLEGIMAKRCSSLYKDGYRSKQWLKIKTHLQQEVVIGGFTEPKGSRRHIGALLVGIFRDGKLHYAGRVGSGIPPKQIAELRRQLEELEQSDSPFAEGKVKTDSAVHWVKPELLAEVKFAEWTKDHRLRQPIFMGIRQDKPVDKVVEEKPAHIDQKETEQNESRVKFSHRDKVFWPEAGYTKGDLIDYYHAVGDMMLPYIKGRPHNLLRQPNGYAGKSFFQKDVAGVVPDWASTVRVYSDSNERDINYFVCNTMEDLELLVQLGCIEINPWNSRVNSLKQPDWLVLDLDPEDISFQEVVKVAVAAKQVCDELKIPAYPKTSGKTGIHVFIPAGGKYSYDQIKSLAELLANLVHERTKTTTSLERSPSKRQHKIYIDFLQNRYGQTLAAPYSVRPTEAASVSTPLLWDEVNDKLDPSKFTIKTAPERFKKLGDIWQPVIGKGIDLPKILKSLE